MMQAGTIFREPTEAVPSSQGQLPQHKIDELYPSRYQKNVSQLNEKSKVSDQTKLRDLVDKSEKIIYSLRSIFPFDLFPDQLIIDTLKVNIINRKFFFAEQIRSVLIKDIVSVTLETGPVFATLNVIDRTTSHGANVPTNVVTIAYILRHKAIRARRIIQGLKVCFEQKVNLGHIGLFELRDELEEIGRGREMD